MSVAADVVRGVLCLGIVGGLYAFVRQLPVLAGMWWKLVEPVVVAARLWVGHVAICVGFWFIRLGAWVAAVSNKLVFPEVREFEKMLHGREEVKL
jgi:hypothetical protein